MEVPEEVVVKHVEYDPPQFKNDSHYCMFSGTRTKNSSASLPYRSESEIIS